MSGGIYFDDEPGRHFTKIHNQVLRGDTLSTKYVGVWGYITSHSKGWQLSENQIAHDLNVGRGFVRSALAECQEIGCLRRCQVRAKGVFGDSAWFITNEPFYALQEGETDPAVIEARVTARYERWKERVSGELHVNLTQNPRSRPLSGFPTSGEPTSGEPTSDEPTSVPDTTKKTIFKKTITKKTNNSFVSADAATATSGEPAPKPKKIDPNEGRADVDQLCTHLADRIEQNGSRRPTITKRWRDAARLLLDADGKTTEQVTAAIDWCQNNGFWRSNILSMPKLREKYEQLRLKARDEASGSLRPAGVPEGFKSAQDAKVAALLGGGEGGGFAFPTLDTAPRHPILIEGAK